MTVRVRDPKIGVLRWIVLLVGLLLTAFIGGCGGARVTTPEAPTARHEVRHARHPTVKKKPVRQIESSSQALYDDDDDDEDDEVGLASPTSSNDPDDASPAPMQCPVASIPVPHADDPITLSPVTGLGPAHGHDRPDEHPPRA